MSNASIPKGDDTPAVASTPKNTSYQQGASANFHPPHVHAPQTLDVSGLEGPTVLVTLQRIDN